MMKPIPPPSSKQVANSRYDSSRKIVLTSIFTSSIPALLGYLPYWSFLPLLIFQLEFVASLHDYGIVGRVKKYPSPKSLFAAADGAYTWQEVAEHNSEESAWISIDGLVYDVTEFIDKHPGGKEMILLSVGREATDLFNSYHPFTDRPRKVLAKYKIGSLATFEHPVYKPDSGFYQEATQAILEYFKSTGLDSKNPYTGIIRMAPVYIVFASCYIAIYTMTGLPMWSRFALAVLMGMCQGMPLTGWMHDASHSSIGRSERWWWTVGRFALDYVSGSSMLSWRNQHVMGHHVYTNVLGSDPDLPVSLEADPRRLVKEQAWGSVYKWQHIYLPPLYGILSLKSRVQDFTEVFSQLKNGPIRVNPISVQDHLRLISSKSLWFFYRVVVPYVFLEVVRGKYLGLIFLCTEFTTGYWLAFNFQVSHISEDAEFLFADMSKREEEKCPAVFEEEWAETQIKTTVDYGHDDVVAAYLSGALNYQTIHHLFPTVSQYHYPAITPIVMKVAEKHGMKFNVYGNFKDALGGHIKHLRQMGVEGKGAELKLE